MVGYKGSKSQLRKVYCPAKPTKIGFKIYAIAESTSGYLYSFDWMKKFKDMIELVCAMMEPLAGRYHQIFTDRAYTSVTACKRLLKRSTYMTGSIKQNACFIPADCSTTRSRNANMERVRQLNSTARGTQYYRQNGRLTHDLWKDSKS